VSDSAAARHARSLMAREYPVEIPLKSSAVELVDKKKNGDIPSLARPAHPRASKTN